MTFEQWLRFNRLPGESNEEAAERYSRTHGLDTQEREQLRQEAPNTASQELVYQLDEDSPWATKQDDFIEDPGLIDSLGRGKDLLDVGFGNVMSGPVAGFLENTLDAPDAANWARAYGEEVSRENLEEAAKVAPAKSRAEILEEDPTSLYALAPEDWPTWGQMAEQVPSSFAAAGGALVAGGTAGLLTANPYVGGAVAMATGNLLSSLQVGGEAFSRAKEEPAIRRAVGVREDIPFDQLDAVSQGKVQDLATKVSTTSSYNRLFNAGALEMASYIPYGPFWARYLLDVGLGTASEEIDRRMYATDVIENLVKLGVPEEKIPELREEILSRGPTQRETLLQAFAMEATFGAPFAAIEGLAGDHRVDPLKTSTKKQAEIIEQLQEEARKAGVQDQKDARKRFIEERIKEIQGETALEKFKQEQIKTQQLLLPETTAPVVPTGKGTKIELGKEAPYRRPPKRGGTQAKTGIPEQAPSPKIKPKASVPKQKLLPQKTTPVPFGTKEKKDTKLLEDVRPPKTAKEAVKMLERARKGQTIATDPKAEIPINETYAAKALGFTDKDGNADVEAYRSIFPDESPEKTVEVLSFSRAAEPRTPIDGEINLEMEFQKAGKTERLSPLQFRNVLRKLTKIMPGLKQAAETGKPGIVPIIDRRKGMEGLFLDHNLTPEQATQAVLGSEGFVKATPDTPLYLIRDNIRGATQDEAVARLVQVVFHEALGHKGLRNSLGGADSKAYKDFINGFVKGNKRTLKRWINSDDGKRYADLSDFKQAEEYIAVHFAEFGAKDPNIIEALAAGLQNLLNSVGLSKKVSMEQVKVALSNIQGQHIDGKTNIITGAGLAQAATGKEGEEDINQSRISDYDRFVSFGGKPPLAKYDRKKYDPAKAPKKTAEDAERYVDASILEAMKNKVWPERLVSDLANFDKLPKAFQDSFRKSMKSGLRKREQELANAVLVKGREAYLQKRKGNVTPDTSAPKGFEPGGAKWKELVDDVPKFARTTPEIQRATRQMALDRDTISQSKLLYGKEKPRLDDVIAGIERARARLNEVLSPDNTGRGRTLFRRRDRPDRRHALASYTLPPDFQSDFDKLAMGTPTLFELDPSKASSEFHKAISGSKEANPYSAAVYVYPQDEYGQMRLFLTDDNSAGFALKDNDIVSVFNSKGAKYKNVVPEFLLLAVEQGGNKLDAFDTVLPSLYSKAGFRVASRLEWDPNEAPPDWKEADFERFNGGKPDVVFMTYSSEPAKVLKPAPAKYDPNDIDRNRELVTDYGEAISRQESAISQSKITEQLTPEVRERMQSGWRDLISGKDTPDLSTAGKRIKYLKDQLGDLVSAKRTTPFTYRPDGSLDINFSKLDSAKALEKLGPMRWVWHGTSRRALEGGRFALKFLLSGEGHLRFGWGIYFTEKQAIADWYRDKDVARKAYEEKQMIGEIDFTRPGDTIPTMINKGGDLREELRQTVFYDDKFNAERKRVKIPDGPKSGNYQWVTFSTRSLPQAPRSRDRVPQLLKEVIEFAQRKVIKETKKRESKASQNPDRFESIYENYLENRQQPLFQNFINERATFFRDKLQREATNLMGQLKEQDKIIELGSAGMSLDEKGNRLKGVSQEQLNKDFGDLQKMLDKQDTLLTEMAGYNWLIQNKKAFNFQAQFYLDEKTDAKELNLTGGVFKAEVPDYQTLLDLTRDFEAQPERVQEALKRGFKEEEGNLFFDENRRYVKTIMSGEVDVPTQTEMMSDPDMASVDFNVAARAMEVLRTYKGEGTLMQGDAGYTNEPTFQTDAYELYFKVADYFRYVAGRDDGVNVDDLGSYIRRGKKKRGGATPNEEYSELARYYNNEGKRRASMYFDSLGIPGLQFLSEGSRLGDPDEGAFNNVLMWNEDAIGSTELAYSRLARFVRGADSDKYGFDFQKGGRWLTLDANKPWVIGPDNEDITGKTYAQTHINTQNPSGRPLLNVSNYDLGLTLQDVDKIGKAIMPKKVQIEGDRMSGPNPIYANLYDRSRAPGKHSHDGLKKGAWAYTKTPKYINREVPQIVSLTSKDIVAWNKSKGTGKSDHIYAHEVVYNVPTALGSFPEFKNEPRGRPYTYGEVVVGEPISEIVHASTSVKMPVYDRVYIVSPGDQPMSPEFMDDLYKAMDNDAPHPYQIYDEVDAAKAMISQSALKMEIDMRKEQINRMPNTLAKAKAIKALERMYALNPMPEKWKDTPFPAMLKDLPEVETSFSKLKLIKGQNATEAERKVITKLLEEGKIFVALDAIKEMMGSDRPIAIDIVMDFMRHMRKKILTGKLADRDNVKALVMTRASQGMSGSDPWTVFDRTAGAFRLPKNFKRLAEGEKIKDFHYWNLADYAIKFNDEVGTAAKNGKLTEKNIVDYYNKAPLIYVTTRFNKSGNEYEDISFFPDKIEDKDHKASRIVSIDDAIKFQALGASIKYGDGIPFASGDINIQIIENPAFKPFLKQFKLTEEQARALPYAKDSSVDEDTGEITVDIDETGGRKAPWMGATKREQTLVQVGVTSKGDPKYAKTYATQGGLTRTPEGDIGVGEFSVIDVSGKKGERKIIRKYIGETFVAVPPKHQLVITNVDPKLNRTVSLPAELPLWFKDPGSSRRPSQETGGQWVPSEYGDDRGFIRAEDGIAWWFTTDDGQLALDYTDFVNKVGRMTEAEFAGGKKTKLKPKSTIKDFLVERGVMSEKDQTIGSNKLDALQKELKVVWRPAADIRASMGDDRIADIISGKAVESGTVASNMAMVGQELQEVIKPSGISGEPGYVKGQKGSFVWLGNMYKLTDKYNELGKPYAAFVGKKTDTAEKKDADALKRRELAEKLTGYTMTMAGIKEGKEGFFKHQIGLGNAPTIDAIEFNMHIAGSPSLTWTESPVVGTSSNNDTLEALLNDEGIFEIPQQLEEEMTALPVKGGWRQELIKRGISAVGGIDLLKKRIKDRFDEIIFTTDPKTGKKTRNPGWDDIDLDLVYHMGHHWFWDRAKGIKLGYTWPKLPGSPNLNEIGGTELIYRPGIYQAMFNDRKLLTSGGMRNWYQMSRKDQLNILSHSRLIANKMAPGDGLGVVYNWPAGNTALSNSLLPSMGLSEQDIDDIFNLPHQTTLADRLRIGTYYPRDPNNPYLTGLYGPEGGIHNGRVFLMGGMGYPMMASMYNNNVAYAAEGLGQASQTIGLMQTKGAQLMDVLLLRQDSHFGNKQMWQVIAGEINHALDKKEISRKALNSAIDDILTKAAVGKKVKDKIVNGYGKSYAPESWGAYDSKDRFTEVFKKAKKQTGLDNWKTMDWLFRQPSDAQLSSTFRFRLASMYELGGNFGVDGFKGGIIPADLMNYIWENTIDPNDRDAPSMGITGIIRIDPNATGGIRAQDAGVPIHPAYRYVVPGQVLATFNQPLFPETVLMGTNPDSWVNQLNNVYKFYRSTDPKLNPKDYNLYGGVGKPMKVKGGDVYMPGGLVQAGFPTFEPYSMKKPGETLNVTEETRAVGQRMEITEDISRMPTKSTGKQWIFGANADFVMANRRETGRKWSKANSDGFTWYSNIAYKYDRTLEIERALRAPHLDPRFHTGLSYSRLPLNQSAFALGSQRSAGTWTGKVQNWLTEKIEPLGDLPGRDLFLEGRRRAKGEIYKVEKAGREVYEALKKTKTPKIIYDYLTTKGASPAMIPDPKERAAAQRAKLAINEIGKRLMDAGLLGQAAIDAHGDKYLPRLYLKYLLNEKDQAKIAMNQQPSDLGYLKKRRNIDAGIRDLVLGEVKDPAFLASKGMMTPGRDLALLDWLSWIAQNPDWVLQDNMTRWDMLGEMRKLTNDPQLINELQLRDTGGRGVTGYWLKNEAQRLTDQILPTLEENSPKEKLLLNLIKRMNKRGNEVLGQEIVPSGYKQIPNSKRFGDLRGLIVRKPIYDDILGGFKAATGDESLAEQVLGDTGAMGKFNRFFKWAKVSANPPSWVRNFVSNMILMNLAGVPLYKLPSLFINGVREIKNNGEAYNIAVDNGLIAGTFSNVELGRIEREFSDLQRRMKRDNKHPMNWVSQVQGALTSVRDKTGDFYGSIDSLGKIMMIKWARDKGMSDTEAVAVAEKWLFDYSLVKPSVRYLRGAAMGAPFITFTSKVAPLLLETALTKPWRFAPYMALAWGLTEMFKDNNDLSEEQLEGLKTALVPYLREKASAGNVVPLPWLDDNGKVQFFDLSYLFPWGMFTEVGVELYNGSITDALKTVGMMGGPMVSISSALTTGIDPFTRRRIANELDTPGQQAADWMWYYYNLAMPPMLHADFGVLKRVKEAMTGELTPEGEQRFTKAQALARLGGMNITPIDPVTSRQKSIRAMQSDILKLTRDRNRNIRERIKMKQSKEEINEARQEFNERIIERRKELKEFIKKTRVPEQLKRAS